MTQRTSADRTPTDGKPFYCRVCGSGFGEYLACEEPCCKLEPEREAVARRRKAKRAEEQAANR